MKRLVQAAAVLLLVGGCKVNIGEDLPFECDADRDCGGEGYVCKPGQGGARGECCITSAEVCDGLDNDCNGSVDDLVSTSCYVGAEGTAGVGVCHGGQALCSGGKVQACSGQVIPTTEFCNGLDDDCDGVTDNGFDLTSDEANCGACAHACVTGETCQGGLCRSGTELTCDDGTDNDLDGQTDCADTDCNNAGCGVGCICKTGAKSETDCTDGVDNDGDTKIDCADTECAAAGCGAGCICQGTAKKETFCRDGLDNDGDGMTDCVDPDCVGQLCKPSPNTSVCSGTSCGCPGGIPKEDTTALCSDTVDNDCNGFTDCADPNCTGSCGAGCVWVCPNKKETNCADALDNDGDGLTNCNDPDCNTLRCNTVNPKRYCVGTSCQ